MKRLAITLLGALIGAAVLVSAALAADPSVSGYGGQAGGVQSDVESGGTLPFTGLDLGLIIGGGALLVVLGVALRRLGRHRHAG